MHLRIERYRRVPPQPYADYQIGCILLEQPFFLDEHEWIPTPVDFARNIVQGHTYDLASGPGAAHGGSKRAGAMIGRDERSRAAEARRTRSR